jgi:hypothetical protein
MGKVKENREEMEKTLKLSKPLLRKSIPVRCSQCNCLVEVAKSKMDDEKTRIKMQLCFDCFRSKLKRRPTINNKIKSKR